MSQVIHHTQVDGIPALFAHTTGPMLAGLVFRVGMADETLGQAGITHLVEHLALHRQGLADYHFNGTTKAAFTHFHVKGTDQEIVAYLNGVCASLTDLPMDRLETEKEILRTEEAGRSTGQLPLWRYGAQGYGLVSYPEWGLTQLRPQDVLHWAERSFTRENAVLWIAGEGIPAGLSLKLASSARHPMPPVTSALPAAPAYFSGGKGGVLLDSVVREGVAAQLYAAVLERELFRSLRQESGFSYTAATDCEARGDGFAVITAFADALPDKQDAVLGGFVDVLAKLQVGRFEQADLDAVRARADEALIAPHAAAQLLSSAAEKVLAGRPVYGPQELRAELWAVTPTDLHAVALEASGTALMQVPAGHRADWAGYAPAPTRSSYTVTGRRFASAGNDGTSLLIGAEGVSLTGDGESVTVLYRACAAKLTWPDGGRRLVGNDGLTVDVEPGFYGIDPQTMATIDAAVHPSATVWLPPRQHQPRPASERKATAAPTTTATTGGQGENPPTRRTGGQTAVLIVFGLAAGLWSCMALLLTLFGATDPQTTTGEWIAMSLFFWVVAALLAWPAIRILRRTRRT
ncbi:peptidase M16 family protein [Actinacidiphila soli]|uniref:insulinase family protein n=1 Tax=Actinacidiphila soli TaxID=2487275 RepID=UPI000FCCA02F|nr:insulinase family protein [Actinacidiphila soli]